MNNENTRSTAHASASGVQLPKGWPGIDYVEVEHIQAVGPDDHVSRLARAHADVRVTERAKALELIRERDEMPLRYRNAPCQRKNRQWPLNPYFSIPVALGLIFLYAWDRIREWAGWM